MKAERDIDARIDSGLKDLNEDLKTIKEAIGTDRTVTSDVARHFFTANLKHKTLMNFNGKGSIYQIVEAL